MNLRVSINHIILKVSNFVLKQYDSVFILFQFMHERDTVRVLTRLVCGSSLVSEASLAKVIGVFNTCPDCTGLYCCTHSSVLAFRSDLFIIWLFICWLRLREIWILTLAIYHMLLFVTDTCFRKPFHFCSLWFITISYTLVRNHGLSISKHFASSRYQIAWHSFRK